MPSLSGTIIRIVAQAFCSIKMGHGLHGTPVREAIQTVLKRIRCIHSAVASHYACQCTFSSVPAIKTSLGLMIVMAGGPDGFGQLRL